MSEHIEQGSVVSETEKGFGHTPLLSMGSLLGNVTCYLHQLQSGEGFVYIDSKSDRNLHERLAKMLTERDEPVQLFLTDYDESAPVAESILADVNASDEVAADTEALIPSKADTQQRTPAQVANDLVALAIPAEPNTLFQVFMAMNASEFVEATVAALRALGETETVQSLLNLLTIEGELTDLLAALPPDSNERKALYSCLVEYRPGDTIDEPLVLDYGFLQNSCARLIEGLRNNPNALDVPDNELSQADRELAEVFALVPLPDLDTLSTAPKAAVTGETSAPKWPDVLARLESAKDNG